MDWVRWTVAIAALAFVGLLGAAILLAIFTNRIDLKYVIGDRYGDASMSRFQLLIFTFVVALAFLYLVIAPEAVALPEVPNSVLILLGISGSSYLVSKSIDQSSTGDSGDGNDGDGTAGAGGPAQTTVTTSSIGPSKTEVKTTGKPSTSADT